MIIFQTHDLDHETEIMSQKANKKKIMKPKPNSERKN